MLPEPSASKYGVKLLMLLELVLILTLRGQAKFTTPLALRITPNSTLLAPDPSSTSLAPKSMVTPTFEPSTEKEK